MEYFCMNREEEAQWITWIDGWELLRMWSIFTIHILICNNKKGIADEIHMYSMDMEKYLQYFVTEECKAYQFVDQIKKPVKMSI